MIAISITIAIVAAIFILAPFFGSGPDSLKRTASANSRGRLLAEKEALIARYIDDENQFLNRAMSKLAWQQRRQFLINRYIDVSRRADFLQESPLTPGASEPQSHEEIKP